MSAVLSLGQCGFDHGAISRHLHSLWGVEVVAASDESTARRLLAERPFQLVLVNRVFDRDGADGIDLIRRWAGESCAVPLMLVSNYADAQARCVEVGGVQGFGKANLTSAATTELLGRFLESKTESEPSGQ